jgi:hypothetical protein
MEGTMNPDLTPVWQRLTQMMPCFQSANYLLPRDPLYRYEEDPDPIKGTVSRSDYSIRVNEAFLRPFDLDEVRLTAGNQEAAGLLKEFRTYLERTATWTNQLLETARGIERFFRDRLPITDSHTLQQEARVQTKWEECADYEGLAIYVCETALRICVVPLKQVRRNNVGEDIWGLHSGRGQDLCEGTEDTIETCKGLVRKNITAMRGTALYSDFEKLKKECSDFQSPLLKFLPSSGGNSLGAWFSGEVENEEGSVAQVPDGQTTVLYDFKNVFSDPELIKLMVPRESGHPEQTGLYLSHRGCQNGNRKEVQQGVQN